MPSEVKVKAEKPPRAFREVDRLTRNSANWPTQAVGVGRTPESERSHQDSLVSLSYQERTGHRLVKRPRNPIEEKGIVLQPLLCLRCTSSLERTPKRPSSVRTSSQQSS